MLQSFLSIGQEAIQQKGEEKEALSQVEKLKRINPGYLKNTPGMINHYWKSRTDLALNRDGSTWTNISPINMKGIGNDFIAAGRVRYIDYVRKGLVRIASASGGLWEVREANGQYSYTNLSKEAVTSPWAGVVGTSPYNENLILYGTGEPVFNHGSGLWKSVNGGQNWVNVPLPGESNNFVDIAFAQKKKKVWLLGESGLYLSTDDGTSWKRKKSGYFSGMAVNTIASDTILVAEYGVGIFRSYNGGTNWTKLTNGLPNENEFERIRLSMCKNSPNVIYAMITTRNNVTLGIYKSINGGDNWVKCRIFDANGKENPEFHWGMAWYCSYISVSPINPDHVTAGGGWFVTSDNGMDFVGPAVEQHPDFHCGTWSHDGKEFFVGNDGGTYAALFDGKYDWDYNYNRIPITQYVSYAVSKIDPDIMVGGSQDNGLSMYEVNGKKWIIQGGDGGGVAVHPYDKKYMFGTIGVYGDGAAFRNVRRSVLNSGFWESTNTGIPNSPQWFRLVETDYSDPPKLYTNAFKSLYYSDNYGSQWLPLDFGTLEIPEVASIAISNEENYNIYVTGASDTSAIYRMSYEDFSLANITHDLPCKYGETAPQVYVPSSKAFSEHVYVVMRGTSDLLKSKAIYKSTDNGDHWQNITGNLPHVPYTILMVHPENEDVIIVGTDGYGLFKTINGGISWQPWDDGIVKGASFTDVDYQIIKDSIYAVVTTYGSGTYKRYLDNELTVSVTEHESNQTMSYYCTDHILNIQLVDNIKKGQRLVLSDAMGREVMNIDDFNAYYAGDRKSLKIDVAHLAEGLYFGCIGGSVTKSKAIKVFVK